MGDRTQPLKYGAVAAGAILIGGAGVAGAGALVNSDDVKNNSLKLKDLSPATRAKLLDRSLVVTDGNVFAGFSQDYAFGTNRSLFTNDDTTLVPPGGIRARGLAVSAYVAKTTTKVPSAVITLLKNGNPTGLSCTTNSEGFCDDKGSVKARAGNALSVRMDGINTKVSGTAIVSIAVE